MKAKQQIAEMKKKPETEISRESNKPAEMEATEKGPFVQTEGKIVHKSPFI